MQWRCELVPWERVHRWHVWWSHDGRPTVILDHDAVTRIVTSKPRTILWFHLGGVPCEVERTMTSYRYPSRRHPAYRAILGRLGPIPRGPDEHQELPGTRDQRLGGSVSPLLQVRTRVAYRRTLRCIPPQHGRSP
jgi:hypothetical protein